MCFQLNSNLFLQSFDWENFEYSYCCIYNPNKTFKTLIQLERERERERDCINENCQAKKWFEEVEERRIEILNLCISNFCNFKCKSCVGNIPTMIKLKYRNKDILFERCDEIMNFHKQIKEVEFTMGEFYFDDLARKAFEEILIKYNKKGKVLTNFSLFEPEKFDLNLLNTLTISVYDTLNNNDYTGYNFNLLDKFNKNKKYLKSLKELYVKIIILPHNIHEIKKMVKSWKYILKDMKNATLLVNLSKELYYLKIKNLIKIV